MPGNVSALRRSGRFRASDLFRAVTVEPRNLRELVRVMKPGSRYMPPYRPVGTGSAATDCAFAPVGTAVNTLSMKRILHIDADRLTVTVEPGVRIGELVKALAARDLELAGGHDLVSRTVGGAVAGGCIGPAFGRDGAFLASQVRSIRLVTPAGKSIRIGEDQKNLLHAFRLSYGMLGVFHEVTLKVRPVQTFAVSHRRATFDQFSAVAERLAGLDVGLKFFLLPFRDRVYLDVRRPSTGDTGTHRIPWMIKDWGESTVLPNVFKTINIAVPVPGVRYRLIDEISKLTQGLVNNRLVTSGSNATSMPGGTANQDSRGRLYYSTWFFPAADFAVVVRAYRDFCLRIRDQNGFRCDMPTMGFRVGRDTSALLSPSFDEPMIALRAMSTQKKGWDDFVIDFGEFARHWGGVPMFNQTREVGQDQVGQVFGSRLDFFRKIRRRFDPDNRMMNPFLSQYFL